MAPLRVRLARTPPGYRLSLGRVLAVYAGLMAALLLAALDQTVVVTALPQIVSDVGGLNSYAWVVTAYMLTLTVTVPLYGKLADVYGLRRLFVVAFALFLVGTLLCGIAGSMAELVVYRGIQGAGAGGLVPLALTTVASVVPPRERGRYQGLIGAAFATAAVAGPTLGGLVVDGPGWRWIFFGSLPVGVGALAVVLATLPDDARRRTKARVDYVGAALLAAGTGAVLLGLIWGGREYAWTSAEVVAALGGGAAALALFAVVERRAPETILPFELLRRPAVAFALLAMGLLGMAMLGTVVFVPLFVQEVLGSSATSAGAVVTPFMLSAVVASILAGRFVSRTGRYRPPALLGSVVLLCGLLFVWRLGVDSTTAEVTRDAIVVGAGLGLVMQLLVLSVQNAVEARVLGSATALVHFVRLIGGTLGVTIMGVIVSQQLPAARPGAKLPDPLPPFLQERLADALRPAFLTAAGFAAALLVVVFLGLREVPLRRSVEEPVSAEPALGSE